MPALHKCDLSIIIPVFNLENYITPMLESLKGQNVGHYNVEIIFVLNNCTDSSEKVIRESGLDCTIINCEEQGCGCARNAGFEISTGEYVWYLDGDDWLLSNTAVRDALDAVKGLNVLRIPFTSDKFGRDYYSMVWQYVFRRSFIEEFRFRKLQPSEDEAYMQKVLAKLSLTPEQYKQIPALDKPLYYYNYLREGSNMWRYFRGEDINLKPGEEPSAKRKKLEILTPHWKERPDEMLPLLNSVAMQQAIDFDDIGMIIVFDGEEATALPEEDWSAMYPYDIKFVHAPHGGVSAARNAALDEATAEYVMYCDADDMFFDLCGMSIILHEMDVGEFDTMTMNFYEETRNPMTGGAVFIQHPQDTTFVHGKVHRLDYLKEQAIRWNPKLKIHEDSYFNVLCRCCADPTKAKYHPTAVYLWRWRQESICREDPDYMQKTFPQLVESSDSLVDELIRRGKEEQAQFYIGGMVFETYYTLQHPKWKQTDMLIYRKAAERRIGKYIRKHQKLWDAISDTKRVEMSGTIRKRHATEGMGMETMAFPTWLKRVQEMK